MQLSKLSFISLSGLIESTHSCYKVRKQLFEFYFTSVHEVSALKTQQLENAGAKHKCIIDSDTADKYLLFCNDRRPGTF